MPRLQELLILSGGTKRHMLDFNVVVVRCFQSGRPMPFGTAKRLVVTRKSWWKFSSSSYAVEDTSPKLRLTASLQIHLLGTSKCNSTMWQLVAFYYHFSPYEKNMTTHTPTCTLPSSLGVVISLLVSIQKSRLTSIPSIPHLSLGWTPNI
jgi:hypothetical protein